MREPTTNHRHRQPPPSRLAVRGRIGEIIEVEGGHIVRSTGRKDRHSKVCTAKGPRDRRVRLSAHTAIQFYDVQDRLGYDRPSKAVDWLIKNAKSAIDELAKLPAWNPNSLNQNQPLEKNQIVKEDEDEDEIPIGVAMERFEEIEVEIENPNRVDFVLPNFDSEIIGESAKSFFPVVANSGSTASFNYQNYSPPPPPSDLVSRRNGSQDLRLSLQSLDEPILIHQAQNQAHHQNEEELFPAVTTTVGFGGTSFQEEHDRFHRMIAWSSGGGTADAGNNNCHVSSGGGGGGGFIFNSPSPLPPMIPTLVPTLNGQGQCLFSQRGPLQSSNSNSNSNSSVSNSNALIRAWIDVSSPTDHQNHYQHQYVPPMFHNQSLVFGGGGGFDSGVFSGFRIPARIQGEEEYGGGVSDNMPSSASSVSLH